MGAGESSEGHVITEDDLLIDGHHLSGYEVLAVVRRMMLYGAHPTLVEGVLAGLEYDPSRAEYVAKARELLDSYRRRYSGIEEMKMSKLRKLLLDRITARVRAAMEGRVVSVDPGPTRSYYALWEGGKLLETGRLDHRSPRYPNGGVDLVVVETPEGWPVRKADGGIQVVHTAIRAGEWLGRYDAGGAVKLPVPAPAWRVFLFGVTNAGDELVKAYVLDAVPREKMTYNNVHTRDAVGMFLAVQVAARESLLF